MTTHTFVLLIASTLLFASVATAADVPTRLRPVDREMRQLLAHGLDRSASLRAIAARLESSDVVVYITCARLPRQIDGQLTFVSSSAGIRYVVVRIAWEQSRTRRIAILGHELQHAVEVAEHPDIVDRASLAREYARFGFARATVREETRGKATFDTAAAIEMGNRIYREATGALDGD